MSSAMRSHQGQLLWKYDITGEGTRLVHLESQSGRVTVPYSEILCFVEDLLSNMTTIQCSVTMRRIIDKRLAELKKRVD